MLSAGVLINEFMAINDTVFPDGGGNYYDWIELHNPTASPVNLDGWHLTDDPDELDDWRIPAVTLAPDGYLVIFASGLDRRVVGQDLHTNFKLSGGGEYLALTDASETIVHEYAPAFPPQLADYSYGVSGGEEHFFSAPTPGAANTGIFDVCQDVTFSVPHGIFYDLSEAFTLELSTPTPAATIWYTVNGDDPTDAGSTRVAYTGPITIAQTRVIRAAATRSGYTDSMIGTQTYIFLDSVLTQSSDQSALGYPDTWGNEYERDPYAPAGGFWRDADYEVDPDVNLSKDDLLGIPSMALTVTGFDLFDPETGIYVNPIERVADDTSIWEKPASLELIDPAGGDDFSVNAGARIHGELARWAIINAKFNFRITFEEEYGDTTLETDFWPDSDVDQYDTMILRAGWGKSFLLDSGIRDDHPEYPTWVSGDPSSSMYLRDQVAHDLFASTGQVGVEGRFVHLYLNGLYWGLYQVIERPDASFNADHFGGEKEDWDIIKGTVGYTNVNGLLKSGTRDAWDELFSYFNFNGTSNTSTVTPISDADYETIKQYLDLESLADSMITLAYIGRADFPGKNWYAAGLPGAPGEPMIEPFRFYVWDSEASMFSAGSNRTAWSSAADDTGPVRLYKRLRTNEQFQLMFADRLHQHFFNDGGMTPEAAEATFQTRVDEIYDGIVGESARWGDFASNRTDNPLLRDVEWIAQYNWFVNSYFPGRTDTVLDQYRAIGLYPQLDAAEFNQHGGVITASTPISLTAPSGTIWYTTDGADPRVGSGGGEGGGPVNSFSMTLVQENDPRTVFIPTVANGGDLLGATWLMDPFDDSQWISGTGGVGYDSGSGTNYDPYINIDVEDEMDDVNPSAFIRIPFTVDAGDVGTFNYMDLGVRCDDGFVAYLNGVKIADFNNNPDDIPGVPKWNNTAPGATNETDAVKLLTWAADGFVNLLVPGENVLAIHGLNAGIGSSDFLMSVNLVAGNTGASGEDPDDVSPTAVQYTGAFQLPMTSQVKARVYNGSEWSALTQATFVIDASADLRVSEINYHPVGPTPAELAIDANWTASDFEFVELTNTGLDPIGLTGVRMVDGIEFDFSTGYIPTVAPGARVVVVANIVAFQARYGVSAPIAGQFTGSLNNGGEQIVLADHTGATIQSFSYDDAGAWPGRADGNGSTLEIIDTAGDYNDGNNWRSSNEYGGTPGAAGTGAIVDVVINEVLTHTDLPVVDAIELYNASGAAIDIGGWFLSDASPEFAKFRIPDGTILDPGEYVVFDEIDFNLTGLTPDPYDDVPTDFGLDAAHGDDVWLLVADPAGKLLRFADHVEFGGSLIDESFGRWPNGAGDLYPMTAVTLGDFNAGPRVGPVLISEVMYNPDTTLVMPQMDFVSASFDADADGFSYADDVDNTYNAPYADGTWSATGGATGGGISVILGLDSPGATSGGWSTSFSLAETGSVAVSMNVRLRMDGDYGIDDYGEAFLQIDGVRYGPDDDFSLIHVDGDGAGGGDVDTGWVSLVVNVDLDPGEHTVTLGAFNNLAAELSEYVQVSFDNVVVTGAADRADLEYVEIHNPTLGLIDLTGWRLRKGVDYDFDDGLTLAAGQRLVVLSYNPANPDNAARVALFRSVYGIDGSIPLVGGWSGQLNNAGDAVQLQRADDEPLDEPDFTPHVIEDEIVYGPAAPWPTTADGGGDALIRVGAGWGLDASSWVAGTPTPGTGTGPACTSGDFDGDGDVDLEDFVVLKQNFGVTSGATLSTGDADGDGDVDLDDFVILKQCFGSAGPAPAAASHSDDATVLPVAHIAVEPVGALVQLTPTIVAGVSPRVVLSRPSGQRALLRHRPQRRTLRWTGPQGADVLVDALRDATVLSRLR